MDNSVITPIPDIPQMTRTDKNIWNEILRTQLEGVMYHEALMEKCRLNGLDGFANMHSHHAKEEFSNYIHVINDYIDLYHEIPIMLDNVTQPMISIRGSELCDKMENALELYEDWEKEVLSRLKKDKEELSEHKCEVDYLIDDVKQELYCIRRMYDDLADDKSEKLNDWLIEKWGD